CIIFSRIPTLRPSVPTLLPYTTLFRSDAVLHQRGVMVIPDILANAGGVTVSYFEWVQDLQERFWDEDDVNRRLERVMVKAFTDVHATAKKYNVDMRTGAYIVGIERVATAMRTRGIWPYEITEK